MTHETMTSEQAIHLAVDRIVAAAQPSQVILFGSRARGEATSDSDIDLMVIEEEVTSRLAEMARLRHAVGRVGAGVDVLVYSQEEAGAAAGPHLSSRTSLMSTFS